MRKYWVIFRVSISERLVYRADFFISTFLRFIPIITTILLWRAIYDGSGRETVGGLKYSQMVGYYLFVMITRAFSSMPRLATDVSKDIRDGELRRYLLQPVDYLTYCMALRSAHKVVYFVMAAAPYALVFWICRQYIPAWPPASMLAVTLLTLTMAFLLGFAINTVIGLLGFWFLEVSSFIHIFMIIQYFLGGHMFPLSLLPDTARDILTWLPFAYETYYPTMILLQQVEPQEVGRIIGMQAMWVIILFVIARVAWARGLRRYAAFGG